MQELILMVKQTVPEF